MHPFDMFDIDVKRRSYKTGMKQKKIIVLCKNPDFSPGASYRLKKLLSLFNLLHAPVSPVFLLFVLLPIVQKAAPAFAGSRYAQ